MSANTSEMEALARDFGAIPEAMVPKIRGVVAKAALNTKKLMQADARKSQHFKQLAATITYTTETSGDLTFADIGPTGGGSASLAGIAYFGTSRPGGGTVRNPEDAMLEEAPNFFEYAFKATEGLL